MMFALPAVAALKAAYPGATLTLLGTPVHAALIAATRSPVDEVRILPFAEGCARAKRIRRRWNGSSLRCGSGGLTLPPSFTARRAVLQPVPAAPRSRHAVGTRTADAAVLEGRVPYLYYQHEPLRALEVAAIGVPEVHDDVRSLVAMPWLR